MAAAARKHSSPPTRLCCWRRTTFKRCSTLLWNDGYRVIGPTVSQEAIIYDEVRVVDDLPRGWTDEQSGGTLSAQAAR